MIGLLAALLGERMPGAGPVEATGNALGQGPVVFYLPQDLVSRICSRGQPAASARNEEDQDRNDADRSKISPEAVAKLREDLFRCATLHWSPAVRLGVCLLLRLLPWLALIARSGLCLLGHLTFSYCSSVQKSSILRQSGISVYSTLRYSSNRKWRQH